MPKKSTKVVKERVGSNDELTSSSVVAADSNIGAPPKLVPPVGMVFTYFNFKEVTPHPSPKDLEDLAINGILFPLVPYDDYAANPKYAALVSAWYIRLKTIVEDVKANLKTKCEWNARYSTDLVANEKTEKTLLLLEEWLVHAATNADIASKVAAKVIDVDTLPIHQDEKRKANVTFNSLALSDVAHEVTPKSNSEIFNPDPPFDLSKAGIIPPPLPIEGETVTISADARAKWEKSKKENYFKDLNWRPSLLEFNVEDKIDALNDLFIGGGYNSAERILAFQVVMNNMNVKHHQEEISSYRSITQYMNVDPENGIFRSWTMVQKFLRKKFTYDTVYDTAKNTLDNMNSIYWPKYFKNANLNEYNDTYVRCLKRTGVEYDKPDSQQLCTNYVKTLPKIIAQSVFTQLRSLGTNNSYLLADYMMAAADVFAFHIANPDGKFRKNNQQFDTSSSKPTKLRRLNNKSGGAGTITVEYEKRQNTVHDSTHVAKSVPTFDPKKHCSYCFDHKNGKLLSHKDDDCWLKKSDARKAGHEDGDLPGEDTIESETSHSLKKLNVNTAQGSSRTRTLTSQPVQNKYVSNHKNKSSKHLPSIIVQPKFSASDDVYPLTLYHPISNLEYQVDALFDTGCSCNVISSQLVECLTIPVDSVDISCKTFGGDVIKCSGYTIPIGIRMATRTIKVCFVVIIDPCDGSVPLITIGKPSFSALGVSVVFPIEPSAITSHLINGLPTEKVDGLPTADLELTDPNIDQTTSLLPNDSTVLLRKKMESTDYESCSLKRVEMAMPEIPDVQDVLEVEVSLDRQHVLATEDNSSDSVLRGLEIPRLEHLLQLNNDETISTAENPCFIDAPSARNIELIHVEGTPPASTPQYPIPNHTMPSGDEFVDKMESTGKYKICRRKGPFLYNIPVLLSVQYGPDLKTIIKVRFCHDLRVFNINLKMDNYPIPTSEEIFKCCDGDLFTELDAESAFYQMSIHPDHQHKLSFMWRGIRYVCVGVPFGLSFASPRFQRVIDEVFPHEEFPFLLKYIDNLIVVTKGKSHKEHADLVAKVIERATKHKLRLSIKKCVFLKRSMQTLGMQIENSTVSLAPSKRKAIEEWKFPSSWAELEHVIGFSSFLRKFVYNFSAVVKPLYNLQTLGRKKINGRNPKFSSNPQAIAAFNTLKQRLLNPVKLRLLDPSKPVCMATDASKIALCVVIYQPNMDEGPTADNIVDFYTRAFKGYEVNYPPFKLEALALHDGIMHFADMLYQRKFKVFTDQKALTYMFQSINTNRTLSNWLFDLLHFDFTIHHIAGVLNEAPDKGSRIPRETFEPESFEQFILKLAGAKPCGTVPELFADYYKTAKMDRTDQAANKLLSSALGGVQVYRLRSLKEVDTEEKQLELIENVHQQGHFGVTAVRNRLIAMGYKWKDLAAQVNVKVGSCAICQLWTYDRKRIHHPIRSAATTWPLDHLQLDMISSFQPTANYKYMLVLVDVFTSYTWIRPLADKKTETIAAVLLQIFADFGTPRLLQNDNEPTLISEVLAKLKRALGIGTREIIPYSPHTNGKVENAIRTISEVVRKLCYEQGTDAWSLAPIVQMFINNKIIDHLKISKFGLMFNRDNNLFLHDDLPTVDVLTLLDDPDFRLQWTRHLEYVKDEMLPILRKAMSVQQWQNIANFHEKYQIELEPLPIGSKVMLRDITRMKKEHPPFVGNFTVKDVDTNDKYKILNNETGEFHKSRVDRSNLKLLRYAIPHAKYQGRLAFVDYIIKDELINGHPHYLVRWTGMDAEDDSWVPVEGITDPALIADYDKFRMSKSKLGKRSASANDNSDKEVSKRSVRRKLQTKPSVSQNVLMRAPYRKRQRSANIKHHLSN